MKWILATISIALATLLGSFFWNSNIKNQESTKADSLNKTAAVQIETVFNQLVDSAKASKKSILLKGEERDQINFLFLGIGGEEHISGNYLTDTIILATLIPSTGKILTLSIPRDLMVRSPDGSYFTRINALYRMKEGAFPGPRGVEYAKKTVSTITGITPDYYAVLDLAGVEKIVDILGGVNVRRLESLQDTRFPDDSYGYETYQIEEGWRYLNGKEAAKYIRTRHTPGGDFDRMRRQQEVVMAIKKKLEGILSLSGIPKLFSLYKALQDHFTTDLSFEEILHLVNIVETTGGGQVTFSRITADLPAGSNPDALLVLDTVIWGGKKASILKPKAGVENYEEIRKKVRKLIEILKIPNTKAQISNKISPFGRQNPQPKADPPQAENIKSFDI